MAIALTTGQLEAYVAQGFFPFARIGACLMVAPMFGARFVPVRMRVLLAVALTALVAPLTPATGIADIIPRMTILGGLAIRRTSDHGLHDGRRSDTSHGLAFGHPWSPSFLQFVESPV